VGNVQFSAGMFTVVPETVTWEAGEMTLVRAPF
jgi:hypothetical protein